MILIEMKQKPGGKKTIHIIYNTQHINTVTMSILQLIQHFKKNALMRVSFTTLMQCNTYSAVVNHCKIQCALKYFKFRCEIYF